MIVSEVLKQHAGDSFVSVLGDVGRWFGGTPQEWEQLMSIRLRSVDKSSDWQVNAGHSVEQVLSAGQSRPCVVHLKIAESGTNRCKCVGFVLKPTNRNSSHSWSSPMKRCVNP